MASDYGIRTSVEHYCAILVMLTSRSELGDAEDLAASMPFVASASAWKLLLDVCKIRRDSARARRVAEEIVRLDPSGRAEPFMVYFREGRPQEAVDFMLEEGPGMEFTAFQVNSHGENDACCHTINQAQKNLHKNPGEQQSPVKQYGGYRLVNWRWHMCT
ncbi:hypothetical protein SELMODRAFT_437926 [Selaginella moellendorffii]|uniref:Pentacotripeptide-repeat region of PRORP domain-containing protein n=1 Tax=Selaginella moellendorffii TaxID=88036 RepID=D8QS14_SELML|nr:hypothetical protein SELMODRAFT_437926 [Selaginella moellendorffii]